MSTATKGVRIQGTLMGPIEVTQAALRQHLGDHWEAFLSPQTGLMIYVRPKEDPENDLPFNAAATALYTDDPDFGVYGPAIITGGVGDDGEDLPITPDEIVQLLEAHAARETAQALGLDPANVTSELLMHAALALEGGIESILDAFADGARLDPADEADAARVIALLVAEIRRLNGLE